MEQYNEGQLLRVIDIESTYEIGKVTEKAIMIKCDDGRWGGDGFKPLWIPKSIIMYNYYNPSKQNSQNGIHNVSLPDWFVNNNSKRL